MNSWEEGYWNPRLVSQKGPGEDVAFHFAPVTSVHGALEPYKVLTLEVWMSADFSVNYPKLKTSALWQGFGPPLCTAGRLSLAFRPLSFTSPWKRGISRGIRCKDTEIQLTDSDFCPQVSHLAPKWGSLKAESFTCNDRRDLIWDCLS